MTRYLLIATPLIVLWLVLSAASLSSWVIGIPVIMLVIVVCDRCLGFSSNLKTSAINLLGLFRFMFFFVQESIRGGIDVGRIVLSSKPGSNPRFFDYPIALQNPVAQHLFINSISLLPGTLSAAWQGDRAHIHALDHSTETIQGIKALESRVGEMFGEKPCP